MHGIMFHHFHRPGERHAQGSITADQFAAMLEHIGRDKLLPAEEWYERAVSNTLKPGDICLTFDDALLAQYDIARPVMESMGLTAFFFVYSSVCQGQLENLEIFRVFRTEHFDAVDDFYREFEQTLREAMPEVGLDAALKRFDAASYLSQFPFYTEADKRFRFIRDEVLGEAQYAAAMDAMIARGGLRKTDLARGLWMNDTHLRKLSEGGHLIGLHSFSHPTRFGSFDAARQADEYGRNFAHIAQATGVKPTTMSHPCNSYNAETLGILRDLAIKVGFCSNMAPVEKRSALEFAREDHANVLRSMKAA